MMDKACCRPSGGGSGGDAVYGLGVIGALVYFLGQAASFQAGIMGIVKSLLWPAYLIHYILTQIKL